jgi:hypothetical protein
MLIDRGDALERVVNLFCETGGVASRHLQAVEVIVYCFFSKPLQMLAE